MNWRASLHTRLLENPPASVYALDAAAHRLATELLPQVPVLPPAVQPAQPCALALGVDALAGLDAQQALHLISQTRLYGAPRLLLVAQADCALDEAMFRALGFMLAAHDTAAGVRLHAFDLDTYKTVPDWLNARFWANPERWEP